VQSASHVRGDYLSQAVQIPQDDTIPQITEGAEYLSVVGFAPLFIGSRVRITVQFICTCPVAAMLVGALFRSGTPDALAVSALVNANVDWEVILPINYEFISASLAPFTYSFRAGTGPNAVRMNGRGARFFGGAYNSVLRVDEYSA
jgi:hypothetical protein